MSSIAVALAPAWRPRPLAGGALLSVLVHGLAIAALAWQAARPVAQGMQGVPPHVTMLWLLREPPRQPADETPVAPANAVVADRTAPAAARPARARPAVKAPPAREAPPVPPPADAPAPAAHGVAFAMPALRIGPGQMPGATRTPPAAADLPVPHGPPPPWLMQPAQQAALAQVGHQLQQRLAALAAPADTAGGRCELATDDPAALRCDRPALQASVAADAPALASLLRAYRGLAPQLDHVALAYAQQRFRLDAR
jgi:hypothetical protein